MDCSCDKRSQEARKKKNWNIEKNDFYNKIVEISNKRALKSTRGVNRVYYRYNGKLDLEVSFNLSRRLPSYMDSW